jgi:hypothetical protein
MPGPERMSLLLWKGARVPTCSCTNLTSDAYNQCSRLDAAYTSIRHPRSQRSLLTGMTDCRRCPQPRCAAADQDSASQQAVVAVWQGGRRVLLCVQIRASEPPASAMSRSVFSAVSSAGAAGGLRGMGFAQDGRVMRDCGDAAQESNGAAEMVCCGRQLGGMKGGGAAAGAGASAAAGRRLSRQLSSAAESLHCLYALVDRLGRDVLRTDAANGLGRAQVKGETRIADSAQHRGPESPALTSEECVIERSLFTEEEDDDELLHHLFQQMDSNNDGKISKRELDAALQSNGNKELVDALTDAVVDMQQGEAGIDFKAFKAGVNLVSWRARFIRVDGLRRFICTLKFRSCDHHEDAYTS